MVWLRRVKFRHCRAQVQVKFEATLNYRNRCLCQMSNEKKLEFLFDCTWEIKISTSQHLPSLKNVPINLLTALSTTDTYRFYFVKRETVLLVDGEPHGLKMLQN